MGDVKRRLRRIESERPTPACPSCGHGGSGPVRIVFAGVVGPEGFEEEHCPECGRPLNLTLRLGETDLPHRGETEMDSF